MTTLAFERTLLDEMRGGLVSKAELAKATGRTLTDIDKGLRSLIRKGKVAKQVGAQVLYVRTEDPR